LTISSGGDDAHISRVVDGGNETSSQNQLLPSLSKVEDVDTITTSLEHVTSHVLIAVGGTGVRVASEELSDIILCRFEAVRNLRHLLQLARVGAKEKSPCTLR